MYEANEPLWLEDEEAGRASTPAKKRVELSD
jgi:hypothetical protein